MLPSPAGFDQANRHVTDPERPPNLAHALPVLQHGADLAHFGIVQLCIAVINATRLCKSASLKRVPMQAVFSRGNVFKVIGARVISFAVLVVDLMAGWSWAKKRVGNKQMHLPSDLFPASYGIYKPNLRVTAGIFTWAEQSRKRVLASTPQDIWLDPAHMPKVGDLVDSLPLNNWHPLFKHTVIVQDR